MQYVHLSSEDSSFSFDLSNSILVAMQRESSWYTPFQIAHGKKKKKSEKGMEIEPTYALPMIWMGMGGREAICTTKMTNKINLNEK